MNCFGGKEKIKKKEDTRMVKFELFFTLHSLDIYYKKIITITFVCMVIPLHPHSVYT